MASGSPRGTAMYSGNRSCRWPPSSVDTGWPRRLRKSREVGPPQGADLTPPLDPLIGDHPHDRRRERADDAAPGHHVVAVDVVEVVAEDPDPVDAPVEEIYCSSKFSRP